MTNAKYEGFDALGPFFALIKQALVGTIDGEHFFDMFIEDVIFEYPMRSLARFLALKGALSLSLVVSFKIIALRQMVCRATKTSDALRTPSLLTCEQKAAERQDRPA
jgi:hypothetical protein